MVILGFVNTHALNHTREMLHEQLGERTTPIHVQDKIVLAPVLAIETDVVVDSNFFQHVQDSHLISVWKRTVVAIVTIGTLLDSQVIWCVILIEPTLLVQNLLPVVFIEFWEEGFKLGLQAIILNHCNQSIVREGLTSSWFFIYWFLM